MYTFYYRTDEGEGFAVLIGFLALTNVITSLLIPQVTDQPVNMTSIVLSLYFGLSNWAYAYASYYMSKQSWWLDR
jgi:predicted membrane chloride channel (bestrophin family)